MDNKEALELLKESIRVNTVLGNEKELADHLQTLLDSHDIPSKQVEYSSGRNGLVVTLEGNQPGPVLGFSGHLDVVPIGEVEWDDDPFAAVEKDGKLYGRGSCDMKSGLISAIVALIRIKKSGFNFNGTIKMLITVGEETSSIGATQLVNEGYANDLDALIINEPTDLKVGVAHKGALWPRITTFGKTAHGSMPHKGVNAIEKIIKFVSEFNNSFDFSQYTDDLLGHSTSSLNIIRGGNGTNVVPDKATVELDIRTLPQQDHEQIKSEIEAILYQLAENDEDFKYEIEYINDLVSIKTDPEDPFTQIVNQSVREVLQQDPEIFAPSYYTDGSEFVLSDNDYPIIIIGPGEAEMAHQPNEYVVIDKYFDMIDINQKIIENYFS